MASKAPATPARGECSCLLQPQKNVRELIAGHGEDAGEGGEDDYGQVYDEADAGEHPQVDDEAMHDQAGAPMDYADDDDEDLYNDIVPGIGQVDGVSLQPSLPVHALHCGTVSRSHTAS